MKEKDYRLQLLSFHGHCPSKYHQGNVFTSLIACYGLIPSSTIYACYLNTNMVPIFQKLNELWDFYQFLGSENLNEIRCQMKRNEVFVYYTVNVLNIVPCNLLNDANVENNIILV